MEAGHVCHELGQRLALLLCHLLEDLCLDGSCTHTHFCQHSTAGHVSHEVRHSLALLLGIRSKAFVWVAIAPTMPDISCEVAQERSAPRACLCNPLGTTL